MIFHLPIPLMDVPFLIVLLLNFVQFLNFDLLFFRILLLLDPMPNHLRFPYLSFHATDQPLYFFLGLQETLLILLDHLFFFFALLLIHHDRCIFLALHDVHVVQLEIFHHVCHFELLLKLLPIRMLFDLFLPLS